MENVIQTTGMPALRTAKNQSIQRWPIPEAAINESNGVIEQHAWVLDNLYIISIPLLGVY